MLQLKLIESPDYYRRRRWITIIQLFMTAPIIAVIYAFDMPIWAIVLLVAGYIGLLIFTRKNFNKMQALTNLRKLEMEEDRIRIHGPGKEDHLDVSLQEVNKILIPEALKIPMDSLPDLNRETVGKPIKNYIILSTRDQQYRFDFVVDSHYMISKLEGLFKTWTRKGYQVERIVN